MKDVGFGILKNGLPIGIWPLPFQTQSTAARRYKERFPTDKIEVVPVFVGKGIEPAPPIKTEKELA